MQMDIHDVLLEIVNPNEKVTAEDVVGRLVDRGYHNVPTACSLAHSLRIHPGFSRDWENHKRVYRRRGGS